MEEKTKWRYEIMSVISMKQLLEAGVHFGHQTRRWNPKMAEYIYTERNGIYIIDLQKSVGKVDEAYNAVKDIAAEGGKILFVGTKKQAQDSIKAEAERCGMYYVNERWLGGMLTNFETIQTRIKRLKAIEKMSEDGTFDVLPKKEVINLKKEWAKLEKNLGGIKDMKDIPDAIFVVDPKKERICIQEAHILGIPLIGIVDTNCDPEELDYVIPGNDDAIRAVKLIVSKMADAVIEANQGESLAEETEEALREATSQIVEAVHSVLEKTPPELASDIADRGIVLTGGGSLLSGLEDLIESKTGINTMTAEDPMTAVAIGTGKFIEFLSGYREE